METLPEISSLSDEAKDALIVALWEEIQRLRQELAGLKKGIVHFRSILGSTRSTN